ncbi:ATP synthase small subunit 6, mitochondrial-like isoform X1 [Vigna umbellata]|uniref:ATP synthase small subunit 6, mitochondrial-like isoform X1 n=1 Tax=Vigna umbellata TaxID=87088 RepID=UPI001F5E41C9|nr:ATP synthase small subunit 6, mitochondrial-like isoform X1 [Vigna umbellata]
MRKFDPWLVFFKREWERNWPFLVGFAVTGTVITKFSLGLTEEDAKNSKFVQAHKSKDVRTERGRAQPIKRFANAVLFSSMLSLVSLTSL